MAKDIADARARGVTVSAGTVALIYHLADLLDLVERTSENQYLVGTTTARLQEERKNANLYPPAPIDAGDDVWSQLAAQLTGDAPP